MERNETVNVLGLGYIGLPTAVMLAQAGYRVHGVDIRPEVVERLNRGESHVCESGVAELLAAALAHDHFRAESRPGPADCHIIAVPTPILPNKRADLSYVRAATQSLVGVLKKGDLVVLESTVPPGTCVNLIALELKRATGLDYQTDYLLAHCPERVIPGKILHEIVHNDRIIGGATPEATRRSIALYSSFVEGKLHETDATTAEMCKLMENTYRDVNIALANELASVADLLGIDIHAAIALANHHPRVNILTPGIGVGGHCIPVDPWFIVEAAGGQARLIEAARRVNDSRPELISRQILDLCAERPGSSVALLGLTYKENVDDVRESPAVEVSHLVASQLNGQVVVTDPHISALPAALAVQPNLRLVPLDEAVNQAEIVVTLVAHAAFKSYAGAAEGKLVLDLARVWQ